MTEKQRDKEQMEMKDREKMEEDELGRI